MNVVTTGRTITVAIGTEVSNVAVGRVTVTGGGVGVGDDGGAVGVGVGDGVGVGVAIGVGVAVGSVPVIVIRPFGAEAGSCESLSVSAKIKLCGAGFQTNGLVAPGLLLTLTILRLNNVPDPFNGVLSCEKADMRRVLSVPGPLLIMFPATAQLLEVSPAAATGGLAKLTIAESKVKSPWKKT
jgi:hypothetical protein